MSVDEVVKLTDGMTVDERLELISLVWERLPTGWQPEMTDELRAELDRREAEEATNPDEGYTLEEVFEYVKRKR